MQHPPLKSRQSGVPEPGMVTTTIFISNLHCPSCINSIRSVVAELEPQPQLVSHSIISHSVTLRHPRAITSRLICDALERTGFEVHSFYHEEDGAESEQDSRLVTHRGSEWKGSLEQAVSRWRQAWAPSKETNMAEKRQRHVENCKQCRDEEKHAVETAIMPLEGDEDSTYSATDKGTPLNGRSSTGPFDLPDSKLDGVVVDSGKSRASYKATLSISGMTCSSCVSSITHALEKQPWVESVNVNLITASATVMFSDKARADEIIEIIEDCGFEGSIEHIDEIAARHSGAGAGDAERWRATYSIGGMTCSSCVGNVTNALEQLDYIDTVDVNLLSHSAVVVFRDKKHLAEIQETIEDSGYDAALDNISNLKQDEEQDLHRTVSLHVDGVYCRHCPNRIFDTLTATFGQKVEIEKLPSESDPILRIRYLPEVPTFTIRNIMTTLAQTDAAFNVSVHHPPTIEDRARHLHAMERRRILLRLILSLVVAVPTFIIGIVYMSLVKEHNKVRMFFMDHMWVHGVSRAQWALFILATPVYFMAADVFHRRALKEMKAMWRPGSKTPLLRRFFRFGSMNMLMSLGTSIAYFASIAELGIAASGEAMVPDSNYYFDSVVFLTMFLLIGRFLEAYSKARTGDAVTSLGKLRPAEAVLIDQVTKTDSKVPVDLLEINDLVRVHHGATPPFDGIVLDGNAKFDESSLTGESRPISKEPGDTVYSGTVNKGSPIIVKITSISGTSMLDQIIKVVREGQTRRAPIERAADVITSHFVPFVVFVAVSTWIIWLALGLSGSLPADYRESGAGGWPLWSLRFAIAVFVVACPCGIGLAAPTALFVGGGLAARHGILVKGGGEAFQEASQLDCIVFDKTGTLTQGGDPQVTDHEVFPDHREADVLGMALKLEEASSHPVANAIVSFCSSTTLTALDVIEIDEIPGKGLKGYFKPDTSSPSPTNKAAIIGNEAFMADYHVAIPPSASETLLTWKHQGKSVALLATQDSSSSPFVLAGIFAISDPLRPEALPTITALQSRGLDVWLLSGDNPTTAHAVGKQLNIPPSNIIAGVLPDQKAEKIKYLQQTLSSRHNKTPFSRLAALWHKVFHPFTPPAPPRRALIAMVGDGINDAPALAHADVSIAIGSGSAIALSSSSFILVSSNLTSLLTLIDLSRKVFRRVWFNFGWALVYNLIAMPVSAGALYAVRGSGGEHVRLDPVWASLAMALSSVSVVCSSLLLRTRIWGVGFREARNMKTESGEIEAEAM